MIIIPKILTEEEKLMRKYKRNKDIKWVLECKKCHKVHELLMRATYYYCSCKRNLIYATRPNHKWCNVIFDREKYEKGDE